MESEAKRLAEVARHLGVEARPGFAVVEPLALPIASRELSKVSFCRYVPFLRLHFFSLSAIDTDEQEDRDQSEYVLIAEEPVNLTLNGESITLDPSALAPRFLELLGKRVAQAWALPSGSLEIEFSDGDRLAIAAASSGLEPWQLEGEDDYLLVSVADGGLCLWEAEVP